MRSLFTPDELRDLARALAATRATADLLGRARVRARQVQAPARPHSETDYSCFDDSAPLVPLAPLKALEWFRSLFPGLSVREGPWVERQQREAFSLAVTTEQSLLERIHAIIADVLETGRKVSAAPRMIREVLDEAGLTPRNPDYASMVFRTNMMGAYNRGAQEELKDLSEDFPVWKYLGIRDGRQGSDHEPHFDRYYPSSVSFEEVRGDRVFNCRCTFQPIYKDDWRDLQARGARLAEGYER